MIYLLSQMMLALAVAIVLGIAIGWIIHSATRRGQEQQLKQAYARKSAQLTQAQSDVAMLTDDYDELHRKTQEQIDILVAENKQIPSLASNLEKSQLLVKQMMQRHEAKVRDLTNENKKLVARVAEQDKQEQTKARLATELDNRRRQSSIEQNTTAPEVARFAAAESTNDPFDEVMELGEDLRIELDQTAPQTQASADGTTIADDDNPVDFADENVSTDAEIDADIDNEISKDRNARYDAAEANEDEADDDSTDDLDSVHALDDFDDLNGSLTQPTLNDETGNDDETGSDIGTSERNQEFEFGALEDDTSGARETATLFEPVSQHDDLQQIFGIGPLTEKALNELGITSYSQLADLEEHEIQRIADALQIGPGRIERDNWVGNARRQLEEVLEQL